MLAHPGANTCSVRRRAYRRFMETSRIGDLAEAAVRFALLRERLTVLEPVGGQHVFDLVVKTPAGSFLEVQVKHGRVRNGCVEFKTRRTDHGYGAITYRGLIDLFAVYVSELDRCFVIPVEEAGTSASSLRIAPTANGQAKRVRFAEDYALERWAARMRCP